MCTQFQFPTPSGRCLVKLVLLLVFCCCAESAAEGPNRIPLMKKIQKGANTGISGIKQNFNMVNSVTSRSCISYGHSCWGGHGKRNHNIIKNPSMDSSITDIPTDTKLFWNRLISNTGNKAIKEKEALDMLQSLNIMQDSQPDYSVADGKMLDDSTLDENVYNPLEDTYNKYPLRTTDNWRLIKFLKKNARTN